MKPVLFTAAAEADVEEAYQWYQNQRTGLGAAFLHALDIAVSAVETRPEMYPVLHRNTHRVLLPQFPYGLYYRVMEESVLVVGCIHAKRHPRVWRSR